MNDLKIFILFTDRTDTERDLINLLQNQMNRVLSLTQKDILGIYFTISNDFKQSFNIMSDCDLVINADSSGEAARLLLQNAKQLDKNIINSDDLNTISSFKKHLDKIVEATRK